MIVDFVPLYSPLADNPITIPDRIVIGTVALGNINESPIPTPIETSAMYLSVNMLVRLIASTNPIVTGISAISEIESIVKSIIYVFLKMNNGYPPLLR